MDPLEKTKLRAREGISHGLERLMALKIIALEKEVQRLHEELHNSKTTGRRTKKDIPISTLGSEE